VQTYPYSTLINLTMYRPSGLLFFNPSDLTAGIALSNNNLTATNSAGTDNAVRSNAGTEFVKVYMEFVAGATFGGTDTAVGLATPTANLTTIGVAGVGGVILKAAGTVYLNGTLQALTAMPVGPGDTVRIAYDWNAQKMWFSVNGGNWNGNATYDPATGVGGIIPGFSSVAAFAVFCSNSAGSGVTANFGATAFTYAMPSGYMGWEVPSQTPSTPAGFTSRNLTTNWRISDMPLGGDISGTISPISLPETPPSYACALLELRSQ
jgi:hypothetical protein